MADDAPTAEDLTATEFLETEHPAIKEFVAQATEGAQTDKDKARRLFAQVRDGIRYDPYQLPVNRADYRASAVLAAGKGFCVAKSVLLTAAARAAGIPSRLGFADVTNHLQSDRLREQMGTDLFVYHGYSTLFIDGRWLKASSAFNKELCARFGVEPLDFDGTEDALLHPFTADGGKYMEYVADHGTFTELPYELLMRIYTETYPALTIA